MRADFNWTILVVSFWWGVANTFSLTKSLLDTGRGQDFKNLMEVNFTAESGSVRPVPWNLKIYFADLDIAWKSLLSICSLQKDGFNLHQPSTVRTAVWSYLKVQNYSPVTSNCRTRIWNTAQKVLKWRWKLLNSPLQPIFREKKENQSFLKPIEIYVNLAHLINLPSYQDFWE